MLADSSNTVRDGGSLVISSSGAQGEIKKAKLNKVVAHEPRV